MIRQPYAAVVLQRQIQEVFRSAKPEAIGEIDGFGVRRSLGVTGRAVAKRVYEVLEIIDDPRIADLDLRERGLIITFVPGPAADDRREFPLAAVVGVLKGD